MIRRNKYNLSTPQTRQPKNVHSGMTPSLSKTFQKISEFLNTPSDMEIRVPMLASDEHPMVAAILACVQDLRVPVQRAIT